jgi:hypothetical protein
MVDMCDVIVRLRPVYPIAVRIPNFFKPRTLTSPKFLSTAARRNLAIDLRQFLVILLTLHASRPGSNGDRR